jgi:hypothetical protein
MVGRIGPALCVATLVFATGCASLAPLDPRSAESGGPLTPNERATNVLSYELVLEVLPERKFIGGIGTTRLKALEGSG